jgi:hypothetical protein
MSRRLAALAATALALLALPSAAQADVPAWKLRLSSEPTNLAPEGEGRYLLLATNVGTAIAQGPIAVEGTMPEGIAVKSVSAGSNDQGVGKFTCALTGSGEGFECHGEGPVHPGYTLLAEADVEVGPLADPSLRTVKESVSGGAAATAEVQTTTTISDSPAAFAFLPGEEGFAAPALDEEGGAQIAAGSHPYELVTDLGFPTTERGGILASSGHPRDISVDLPPGLIGNPAATPVLCTEAQLTGSGCPPESAVGTATATTQLTGGGGLEPKASPLFNMVPAPGVPAAFGFDAAGVGIFVHVQASLRSETDFGVTGSGHDVIARDQNPIFAFSVELWGDPSAEAHKYARGKCLFTVETDTCTVDPQEAAFLSLPADCPGTPAQWSAEADSWEEPGREVGADYASADLSGAPAPQEECDAPPFEPKVTARPTTNLAESPSGLDFELEEPQQLKLSGPASAAVKDTVLTLPQGLEVNASAAAGLGACDPAQIGMLSEVGDPDAHFSKAPAACPDAARIGSLEARTPLLAEYNEDHKVEVDPGTGEPKPRPLHGSVYLARPFQNPFGSLIALYLTVEDPRSGTFVKLASEVTPDPATGQLTATLRGAPQLPVSDLQVHIFAGNRGGLQTPAACGAHSSAAELVPWSAPEGPTRHLTDSFQIAHGADGGPCPAGAPFSPALSAGTLAPQAGAFSPLRFKLSRTDGSARIAGLEASLPPGLTAKLAGVGQCSEAQIAAAVARSGAGEGALEQLSPSCPASSEVGTVVAGAGAGPTPLYVSGHAYLAGPYKGAPLSMVFITPAIAGPFDLGAVVIRSALYLDPTTGQPRAVSDPLPRILHGIPLDLRSAALRLDRPGFTLNPTSCSEKSFAGSVASTLGQIAPISERFQVGGCSSLPYKPTLTTRLFGPSHRGAHPRFKAVFTAKAGEANTRRIVLALPHSEFIDQAHFRTICTRVQFAANQCPAGSIYGHVRAITPLLDYPLEGPIYLRSSTNKLPDAVAALRGPPSQPIEIDSVARVDSVNGGLRFTIATVPDAPIAKVVITAQGNKKGLFQNSTDICKGTHRATLDLEGQNGKAHDTRPLMRVKCPKPKGHRSRR